MNKNVNDETSKPVPAAQQQSSEGSGYAIDFDSDEPLVCNRDQSGDTTCEACQ